MLQRRACFVAVVGKHTCWCIHIVVNAEGVRNVVLVSPFSRSTVASTRLCRP